MRRETAIRMIVFLVAALPLVLAAAIGTATAPTLAEGPINFDAIDAQEQKLDWDMRIFQDRQQALTYVCETPVILEQRVFALGRAIAAGLK